MCCVLEVAQRDYVWTEDGLADARRRKVAPHEVKQALYAQPGLGGGESCDRTRF